MAGGLGVGGRRLRTVEILMEGHWIRVEPLPVSGAPDSFTLHNGELYLCISDMICYTKPGLLQSTHPGPVWSKLASPGRYYQLASYGQQLIGLYRDIRAYSPITMSWLSVADVGGVPGLYASRVRGCVLLPTGDLLVVVWGGSILRASLRGETQSVLS